MLTFETMNLSWEELAAVLLGAAAGFLYYWFFRCGAGTGGALRSNPIVTTMCGAMIGFMMVGQR